MAAGEEDVEISAEEYEELLRLAGQSPTPAKKAAAPPANPFGGFNPFAGFGSA
eukprot:CAMPEP_0172151888 /NCGR_PEP_ID=MMETSP1050-20130122/507_1 /TAXON_ID=233186 /ORGANISM="Cryptomonas curvata, Strain CCAP979/52" /LENGTH=52 /DNA_ID=CAMNT_0012820099 /DNA_START=162 /DNA_END=316 /DNA_ORIENTATION=-